jgi:hypothetical protein
MADQVQFLELGFQANTASIDKTKKEVTGLVAPVATVEKAILKLSKAEQDETKIVKNLATQIGKLSDEGKENVKVANERLQVLRKQEAAIRDIEQAEKDLINVLEEETRKQREAAAAPPRQAEGRGETTQAVGGVAGGLGAAGTLAGTLGATGLQEILTGLDDLLTVGERAPEFVQSIQQLSGVLPQAATAASGAATASTALATAESAEAVAAGAAAPATAGLAAGIGAMALAAAPFAAAAIARFW